LDTGESFNLCARLTEVGHGEPDDRVDLDLGEVLEVTFDARIHDLVAVVVGSGPSGRAGFVGGDARKNP
jgi:hypothetical protein